MKLTTKGRFAVMAMADLAMQPVSDPVTLSEISARQGISLSYLEQLFGKLRRHALVDSVRGPGGGYRLAKNMVQISIADIVLAVDESLDATQCGGMENCHDDEKCITHDLWTRLSDHILAFLAANSLKQLVDDQVARRNRVSSIVEIHDAAPRSERVSAIG